MADVNGADENGTVVGAEQISGIDKKRLNITIMGDGFVAAELPGFKADAAGLVDYLTTLKPFDSDFVQSGLAFHRIDVASTDSGAADPVACGGTGAAPKTYFNSTFCGDGVIRRLVTADDTRVVAVSDDKVPETHNRVLLVNSAIYGGSGGSAVAVVSRSGDWHGVVAHELGHSAFGLADEYQYYSGCGSGEVGHDTYAGGEPAEANVTANTDRKTLKWRRLVAESTKLPTMINNDPATCLLAADPNAANPVVGAYDGARYFHAGLYRGAYSCMMRNAGQPFCAVCQRKILQTLTPFMEVDYAMQQGAAKNALVGVGSRGTVICYNGRATFDDPTRGAGMEGRVYLRTADSIFSSISFVAEITATVTAPPDLPPQGIVFFGMGEGLPRSDYSDEPKDGSHVFCRVFPEAFFDAAFVVTSNLVENPVAGVGSAGGVGTHRLQLKWNAETLTAQFLLHAHYQGGPFVPTATLAPVDCSANGFNAFNARLFFGGGGGTMYSDFTVRGARDGEGLDPTFT